jgi:uncharacterized cupredoxin-like copper-binding protein
MRRFAILASLVAAAVIAGCGSSSSSSSSAPASSGTGGGKTAVATGTGAVTLRETEFKITPATARLSHTGTLTIKVTNNGSITHALAVQTPSGVVMTPHISPGHRATLKVNASKAGAYTFYCPIGNHRRAGMHGMFIVAGSSTPVAGGGGSSSSQTSSSGTSSGRGGGGGYAY